MPDNGEFSKSLKEFLTKIDGWYAGNHEGFRTLFDATIANVVKCPADSNDPDGKKVYYDWRGKGIEDLKNLFTDWYNDWYKTKPNDGLDYIEKFSWLTYENDYGMVFVTCGPGLAMTADYARSCSGTTRRSRPRSRKARQPTPPGTATPWWTRPWATAGTSTSTTCGGGRASRGRR
ncbi:hypothetical protein [Kitasatospora sp. NPDC056273]|uniref:hypothetical protein n=1 Tax=Kitasatospora sp. NPDC056273 TaxID=3345769 RepID=UPI0035DB303C